MHLLSISLASQMKQEIEDVKHKTYNHKVGCYSAGICNVRVIIIVILYTDGWMEDVYNFIAYRLMSRLT